ncbi:MAG: serine protease [Verrucomicrobiota bacterium]|jgi:S1-C subfamily serine protease
MTGKLKFAAAAGVYLALAGVCFPLWGALGPEEIYEAALPSSVTLEVENAAGQRFVGSAFLAVGEGLAVTAWHVVHDARRVEARFSDHRRVSVAGLVDRNEELDLALIRLETDGRPRIRLSSTTPRIGSRIYVVGAPRGLDFSISDGLISQIRTVDKVRYYQVSCPISPGDSGGPVLNERGEALGVMSWRKSNAENVGFAVPSAEVARLAPNRPLVPWQATAGLFHPAGQATDKNGLSQAAMPAGIPSPPGGFGDFQRLLSERAGRRLIVTVEEESAPASRFSFEVPKPGVR